MVGYLLAMAIYMTDLNLDGVIDSRDMVIMLGNWGNPGVGDLNDDGVVDSTDFARLMSLWRAGWGVHDTGDGEVWFVPPGRVISWGPSPFPGHRRLVFLDNAGAELAIDMLDQ